MMGWWKGLTDINNLYYRHLHWENVHCKEGSKYWKCPGIKGTVAGRKSDHCLFRI